MNRNLFCLIPLVLLFGISSAGTVTLTGSCRTLGLQSRALNFSLSNSGNDTAYNLIVVPVLQNVQTSSGVYTINNIGPGAEDSLAINVTNVTEQGVSGGYFLTSYQQGTDVFSAVFPCLYAFGNTTQSQILITPKASVASNGNATVTVSVVNAGVGAVQVNVSLMLPPIFSYTGSRYYVLTLAPVSTENSTKNATFRLLFSPSAQATYSVAALATYSSKNLSHATLATFAIASPSAQTGEFASILMVSALIAIVLVVALILFSIFRRRKAQVQPQPPPPPYE